LASPTAGNPPKPVFLFFSNNLGCVGSLIVSAIATLVLLVLLGVIRIA
jgi:hypothetical protein